MAKPTITTRAGKGSALTWTEGDSNLENLRDATITIKADTGGTDVVSDLNGTVTLVAGTNITLTGDNTAKTVTINSTASGGASALDDLTDVVITAAATNDVLVYNGTNWVDTAANTLTVSAASTASTATNATNINISTTDGNTSDTTLYPVMVGAASTGQQLPHVDTGLSYNASTNALTATTFSGNATSASKLSNMPTMGYTTTVTSGTAVTLTSSSNWYQVFTGSTAQTVNLPATNTLAVGWNFYIVNDSTAVISVLSSAGTSVTPATIPAGSAMMATVLDITAGNPQSTKWDCGLTSFSTFTGSGNLVFSTSPSFTTPSLGTPSSGTVTNLTGTASININGTVGATTPTTGAFTTLSASTSVSFSPSGAITLNPTTAGTINNMSIGATTASTGRFTTLSATGTTTLATSLTGLLKAASGVVSAATAGTDYVAVGGALGTPSSGTVTNLTGTASININGTVGATTPAAGTFTTATLDAGGELRLNNTADTFYVGFKAGTLAANKIWTLPTADGTANQVLKTDGAGNLGWSTAGGGSFDPASPGAIGGTTPDLGTFTGLIAKGNGTTASPARLSLPVVDHYSTAWTTNGIGISAPGGFTYRDTTSTGTVSAVYVHTLGGATLARTNTGAFTNAATLYVAPPGAGFQTTITNPAMAAFFDGPVRVAGNLNVDGGSSFNGSIGGTSPNTGAFTTLTTTDTVSMTGTSKTVTIAPTGASSSVVINCGSGGTINNMTVGVTTAAAGNFTSIGATTPGTGTFTSITANGTGSVILSPSSGTVTINPNGASTINNTSIGVTTAAAGRFTTLTATGAITLVDVRETVFAIGNSGVATLTPNAANGSVQTITATGNFTLSAFTSPVSGQTITFIITQDATGSRTLTSTMKFAGGSKTLTTTANAIDILTVSYIGTTYYASLAKGFV